MTTPAVRRFASWLPLVVALIVSAPSLWAGFLLDDWVHRGTLRGDFAMSAHRWQLFTFADGDPERMTPLIRSGPFPWFTWPSVKLSFFRPLSSLLSMADYALFGDAAWLAHLHSVLWYLALVAVVSALYRRLLGASGWLSAMLFAVDDAHSIPVDWLANRNAVVAATLAWLGLWAHLRWREDGWRPGRALSVVALAAALSAGEVAIAAGMYLVAFEALTPSQTWAGRVRALWPSALTLLGFVVLYRVMNSGAEGSATYIDPLREPWAFMREAPARLLGLVGAWSAGPLQDVWLFVPSLRPLLVGLGALTVVAAPFAWRAVVRAPGPPALTWLAVGAVASMVPGLATFPSSRLLTSPSFGLCAVAAVFAHAAWQHRGTWAARVGMAWVVGNFVLHPLLVWGATPWFLRTWNDAVVAGLTSKSPPLVGRVVVLTSGDFVPALYGVPILAEAKRPLPKTWQVLSMAPKAHRVTCTSADSFDLEVLDGAMVNTVFEQNMRSEAHPLPRGTTVELDGVNVEVLDDAAGKPTKIRVRLARPRSDYQFVNWVGDRFEPVTLPEVGEVLDLPRAPLPLEPH